MKLGGELRRELEEHARAEAPNEACGVVVLRDGVAERYIRGRNKIASPYRFELEVDPEVWFLEDDGYELAVFHSHVSSPARPSKTDVQNIGLWRGRPYLILSLQEGDLAPFRIFEDGRVEAIQLLRDDDATPLGAHSPPISGRSSHPATGRVQLGRQVEINR